MTENQGKPERATDLGRRGFWRSLAGEALSICDEFRGITHQSLREIASVPDAVMAEMVPVWRDGRPPEIHDDGIYVPAGRAANGESPPLKLFHSFAAFERMMVDQYACGRNLRVIAEHVARASGMDEAAAFAATRLLFAKLCRRGLCHPAAAHLQDREGQS
jgi:hypothetical protein